MRDSNKRYIIRSSILNFPQQSKISLDHEINLHGRTIHLEQDAIYEHSSEQSSNMDNEQSEKMAQFSSLTGCNPSVVSRHFDSVGRGEHGQKLPGRPSANIRIQSQAQTALAAADWNLEAAVGLYFATQDEQPNDDDMDEEAELAATAPGPAAGSNSAPPAKSSARGGKPKGAMTLADLNTGDDDDEERDPNQDLFTGGEKSGLAVKNPDQSGPTDHFRNIMNQARTNRDRPAAAHGHDEEENEPQRPTAFTGRAQTLGGDDAPSQVVQDPTAASASARPRHPRVSRTLHLWADGVSIDDGPLLRFDDPANDHIMTEINQGRAPKALLDVQPDQEVDLNLEPHRDENYVAPKPKYKPFGGQGMRLGSPTPGPAPSSSSTAATAAPAASTASARPQQQQPQMDVNDAQPTLQLQIRLGDGTRLVSRFNTSHTIGDVYNFVDRAQSSSGRAWALMTTFPSKELDDKSVALGDISDFQRGGVVIQKWK